jgi:hypothetical protein
MGGCQNHSTVSTTCLVKAAGTNRLSFIRRVSAVIGEDYFSGEVALRFVIVQAGK